METAFDAATVCPGCRTFASPGDMLLPCPADGRLRIPLVDWIRHKHDPLLGRVVGGRYAVIGMVGRGGMGDVYRAVQMPLGRQVALEVIRQDAPEEAGSRSRFLEEAKRVAAVLARVHAEGVLHGDLKPANVMCLDTPFEEDEIKLLDFGLSRWMADAGRRTGFVMGTREYMAPEQFADGPCDARTDLYGLGGVLFRLAVGASPFARAETAELVRRALSPRPQNRFADAAEMATALLAA